MKLSYDDYLLLLLSVNLRILLFGPLHLDYGFHSHMRAEEQNRKGLTQKLVQQTNKPSKKKTPTDPAHRAALGFI